MMKQSNQANYTATYKTVLMTLVDDAKRMGMRTNNRINLANELCDLANLSKDVAATFNSSLYVEYVSMGTNCTLHLRFEHPYRGLDLTDEGNEFAYVTCKAEVSWPSHGTQSIEQVLGWLNFYQEIAHYGNRLALNFNNNYPWMITRTAEEIKEDEAKKAQRENILEVQALIKDALVDWCELKPREALEVRGQAGFDKVAPGSYNDIRLTMPVKASGKDRELTFNVTINSEFMTITRIK
jgi:hypothetical protein